MRRLLALLVAAGLLLAPAGLALARDSRTATRVPRGVTRINISITFPLTTGSNRHRPAHVTLTRAATVAEVVAATDALPPAKTRGIMCPMYMRIGPVLTVVFRNSGGSEVADATVDVTQGSKGDSGSSACFPIRFSSSGNSASLLGNSWVRLMGKLAGSAIS